MDNSTNVIETPIAKVWMQEDILHVEYFPMEGQLDQAKEHISMIIDEYGEHIPVLSLADLRQVSKSKKEVRSYFSSDEVSSMIKASAILIGGGLSKIVGNLFLKFSKPKCPTRIFSNKEKATAWLKSLKE